MKIIRELSRDIKSEIKDAENYFEKAVDYKMEMPDVSKLYIKRAKDEIEHAMDFHRQAVIIIDAERKVTQPPEYMLEIWNDEHKMLIDRVAKLELKIKMLESGR